MKRIALVALVLAAGAFLLLRWLGREQGSETRLTGVVSANEAVVASEMSGRLRELRVDEGDWVAKGQVVAVLATEELDAQRESKLATIDQLSKRVEQDREKVQLERARVKSQIEGATARLRGAQSLSEEYRAQLEQAKAELANTETLMAQGLVPAHRRERNETMVSVVEARLQTAEDGIEAARAELELHRASERQVRVMAQQVEQTEAQIAQAQAELEQISVRLGYTELRAPLDGMVSLRVAREGEFVAAGAPVVTIVDLSDVWVRAQVEETLVTRLAVGQPLEVRLVSDEELTGRVTFISPEAEFATQRDVDRIKRDIRTFGIKVSVPNPNRRVHPGMTAYVLLPPGEELPDLPPPVPIPDRPPNAPATTREVPADSPETLMAAEKGTSRDARPPTAAEPSPEDAPSATEADVPDGSADEPDASVRDASVRDATPPVADAPPDAAPVALPVPARARAVPPRAEAPASMEPGDAMAEDQLDELLAGIDLENATEEELARLEASLLGEGDVEPSGSGPDAPVEPPPTTTTGTPSEGIELPAWARPRTPSPTPTAEAPETPALRLEGISRIDGKPVAIINGTRVFEGELVAGARVVGITDGTVLLDLGDRRITLTF